MNRTEKLGLTFMLVVIASVSLYPTAMQAVLDFLWLVFVAGLLLFMWGGKKEDKE